MPGGAGILRFKRLPGSGLPAPDEKREELNPNSAIETYRVGEERHLPSESNRPEASSIDSSQMLLLEPYRRDTMERIRRRHCAVGYLCCFRLLRSRPSPTVAGCVTAKSGLNAAGSPPKRAANRFLILQSVAAQSYTAPSRGLATASSRVVARFHSLAGRLRPSVPIWSMAAYTST